MVSNSHSPPLEHNAHLVYRPDIDGLRAVAILSVIIFHAFPTLLSGGFVGVDIFFVISGFLISSIIFRSLHKGDFSLTEFYANRVKRIFPALILILVACYAYGWLTLLPDEFKQLGKHIATGAGFIQNIALWKEAGYFDTASEQKPLMHLWSLAVEEQFYLLYPLLVISAWRLRLNVIPIILFLCLLSLGLNVSGIEKNPVKTFFVPQTRFWEILAGSALAYLEFFKKSLLASRPHKQSLHSESCSTPSFLARHEIAINNTLSVIGLILITGSIFYINKEKSFPGWWATAPVFGALLIIKSGPQALPNRKILASPIMVFIGLISYPLYLWHWPILSFARIIESGMPPWEIQLLAVGLSFLLAFLTYRLLEKPIRFGPRTRAKTLTLSLLLIFAGYVGFNTHQRNGLGFRFDTLSPENSNQLKNLGETWQFSGYPKPKDLYIDEATGLQAIGDRGKDFILFIGDSHTEQYRNTIQKYFEDGTLKDKSVLFLPGHFPPKLPDEILHDKRIKGVVLSYFWAYKYGSNKVDQAARCCGNGKNGTIGFYNLPIYTTEQMAEINNEIEAFSRRIKSSGRELWIILDNPFGEEFDARSKISRNFLGRITIETPEPLPYEAAIERTEPVRSFLIKIAENVGARTIDPFPSLCPDRQCPVFSDDEKLIYKDYDHLSLSSSLNRTQFLMEIFK